MALTKPDHRISKLLGTVSQSGGLPTGAVIERGSNANGEYVKFADGTMICTHSKGGSASVDSLWTLPATFVDNTYSITGSVGYAGTGGRLVQFFTRTTANVGFNVIASSGNIRDASLAFLVAIGRWF